jgi:hypothetical protein
MPEIASPTIPLREIQSYRTSKRSTAVYWRGSAGCSWRLWGRFGVREGVRTVLERHDADALVPPVAHEQLGAVRGHRRAVRVVEPRLVRWAVEEPRHRAADGRHQPCPRNGKPLSQGAQAQYARRRGQRDGDMHVWCARGVVGARDSGAWVVASNGGTRAALCAVEVGETYRWRGRRGGCGGSSRPPRTAPPRAATARAPAKPRKPRVRH